MIIALMVKLLWRWEEGEGEGSERSGLLCSSKVESWFVSYGTSEEEDIECMGKIRSCNSSSDELYDGKICVICYDHQRSCLFTPCGHCITCYNCAKRYINSFSLYSKELSEKEKGDQISYNKFIYLLQDNRRRNQELSRMPDIYRQSEDVAYFVNHILNDIMLINT